MSIIHSQITDKNEIHVCKGFTEAPIDAQRAPVKQMNGTLEWVRTDSFSGPAGIPGPPLPTINVVSITNPVELNLLDDAVSSQYIVSQVPATADQRTRSSHYIYQPGSTQVPYPPNVVQGLNGNWIMLAGDSELISINKTASSNCLIGGKVTINGANPATFDVEATTVSIVDNYTDLINPKVYIVNVPATLGIPVTGIAGFESTHVYVDINGIGQTTTFPTSDSLRDKVYLATLYHTNNVQIGIVANTPLYSVGVNLSLNDLNLALGPINYEGNAYAPAGANLNIAKTSGKTFLQNVNSINNLKSPNFSNDIALVGGELNIRTFRDGTGGFTYEVQNAINPNLWDNGTGVLQPVPAGEWTNRRLYWSPSLQEQLSVIGQATYATKDLAIDAVSTGDWIISPEFNYFSHRATLTVIEGATDLSDPAQAVFTQHGKFGGGSVTAGSPVVVTLQDAYGNSNGAPISTTLAGNPFTIKRGAGSLLTVFDVRNELDASIFSINESGAITGTNATTAAQGLMSSADKTKSDGILSLGSGNIITTDERTSLNKLKQGWLQYTNSAVINTAGVDFILDMATDLNSFTNTLFDKPSSSQFRTLFAGYVKIDYHVSFTSSGNNSNFIVRVRRNGVNVAGSISSDGGSSGGAEASSSASIITPCVINDVFTLVLDNVAQTQTAQPNWVKMSVEAKEVN